MSAIEEFLEHYNREFDHYTQASTLAHQKIDAALRKRGIHAIVTSRAKSIDRLRAKLHKRNVEKHYQNIKEIYADIIDLAGVRIALYFPADRDKVDALIREIFTAARKPKIFPERKSPPQGKRFMGYLAVHHLVRLKTTGSDSSDVRYADTRVEIQVASVLMHAWAEVEHDLEYKPETGELSEDEGSILDEINGMVLSGELALERLQRAIQRRTAKQEVPFRDQFELASYLSQRAVREKWAASDVGKVDVLLLALKHLKQATPSGIERYLTNTNKDDKQRPIADMLVDRILATKQRGTVDLTKVISRALSSNVSPYENNESSKQQIWIGRFLLEWRQSENLLKKIAGNRGEHTNSPLNNVNSLQSPGLKNSLWQMRTLRNSLVHGTEVPPLHQIEEAAIFLRNRIIPELKILADGGKK